MLERAGLMFGRSVEMMAEAGMIPAGATVAIDMIGESYSGKKRDEIARGGRYKGGTSWFETYGTAVIASLSYLPHIGIRPVHKGDAVDKCVRGCWRTACASASRSACSCSTAGSTRPR